MARKKVVPLKSSAEIRKEQENEDLLTIYGISTEGRLNEPDAAELRGLRREVRLARLELQQKQLDLQKFESELVHKYNILDGTLLHNDGRIEVDPSEATLARFLGLNEAQKQKVIAGIQARAQQK